MIATDHSPCPPELKRLKATEQGTEAGRFDEAWGGIASCRWRFLGLERVCPTGGSAASACDVDEQEACGAGWTW